jgi:hypothetical protein
MSARSAVYVYCLVERATRPALTRVAVGLAGASAIETIEIADRLWAVTSQVPRRIYDTEPLAGRLKDINWVADAGVAHEAVVERVVRLSGATVVPMKLFTLFSSPERAQADLRAREHDIRTVIDRIRGCQEWWVRISPPAPRPAAGGGRPVSGTAFLTAKKRMRDQAQAHAQAAVTAAEAAYSALARLAREAERREAPREAATPPLLDATFLVRAAAAAKFRAAVRRAAVACRAAGATLLLTGPWPAYSFVQPRS